MSEYELKEKLRGIISEVIEVDEIPDEMSFRELGADSMMAVEIVSEVERTFKVNIPEDELEELTNFQRVYDKLVQKMSEVNAA